MQADQARAGEDESGEQRTVSRQRNAWEVGLHEVSVAAAVFRAVQHGVEVVEDVLRPERRFEIARPFGNEFEADGGSNYRDELRGEIRFAPSAQPRYLFLRINVKRASVSTLLGLVRNITIVGYCIRNEHMPPRSGDRLPVNMQR